MHSKVGCGSEQPEQAGGDTTEGTGQYRYGRSTTVVGCLGGGDNTSSRNEPIDPSIGGAAMFQYDLANTGNVPGTIGPDEGDERWTFSADGSVRSSPAVIGGLVYIGGGATLYAVDASAGEPVWSFDTKGAIHSSPAVIDGTVCVGTRGDRVYAVDASDGTEQWVFETNGSIPAVGDAVYIGGNDGRLYAIGGSD